MIITKLTPEQYDQPIKEYWFIHWHDGTQWLDSYNASSAYEALIIARDNHTDKLGDEFWIELVDWNNSTLH